MNMVTRLSLVAFLAIAAIPACSKKDKDKDADPPPLPTAPSADPAPTPPPVVSVAPTAPPTVGLVPAAPLGTPNTLSEAIMVTKPQMRDSTGAPDEGSGTLTKYWLEKKYAWNQLESTPETQPAAFLSNTDSERGKRICGAGLIQQLNKINPNPPQHEGMMATKEGVILSLSAVGDTTGMNPNGQGRFCGIASGIQTIATPDGKQTRAIRLTGMFDTPANRGGGGGQFASFKACCQALQQNAASMPPPQNMYAAAAAQYCFGSVAMVSSPQQKDAMVASLRGMLRGVALPAACK